MLGVSTGGKEAAGFEAESLVSRNPGLLERALESLSAGLVVSDATEPDCPIVYANVAFEELTGYDRTEAIGRNSRFLRGPGSDPAATAEMQAAVRDERHTRVTILNYRKDGTPFWNEVSLSPLFDARGRLLHWIELQADVSEREVAVQGLRDAEERYRRLTENLPGIVTYVADYDGKRLSLSYTSPQVEKIFGYAREDWLGERPVWVEALHPDDRARVLENERRRFQEGEPFDLEYRLRASDGSVVWVWDRDTVTTNADGGASRLEGMLVDITASKSAEAALLRGQELHRSVIDALTEGVIVLQPGGGVASANPSAERILGFDPTVGDPMEMWARFERYWEDGTPATLDNSIGARVLATGEPARDVVMKFRRPSGELRWLSLNYERVTRSEQRDASELVVSFRDITARREMVDELRRSDERLRTVVGNAPLILWALDAEGRVTLSEGRGLTSRGLEPAETVGQSAYDLYADHPEVVQDIRCALRGEERTGVADFGPVVLQTHMTPLRADDGTVIGVLGVSMDVTERERAEQRLSHMAMHDSLTGLPNRSLFLDRLKHALARAQREKARCCVLFIDLDRFKRINDSLGHRAGDQILLESADRIAHSLRVDDTVARLGGDEFTVLCEGIRDEEQALRVADKVSEELGHLYELDDGELYITASVGVALSDDSSSPEQLLRDADAAMYRAKSRGRARTELFDEESRSHTVNRLALESALHGAVERDEFRLLYQPKVSLSSGRVVGFEALLRWQHPTRGLLAPEEFIDIAEDSGLIVPIGEWVLNEAATQTAKWSEGREGPPFLTCVNLSARQFAQPDIVALVGRAIQSSGVDPTALCLEITESVLMEQTPATAATLHDLKAIGVKLAIDDFGTGYSSLGYLQRFRLDFLKVDRSFVEGLGRDPGQTAIVDAVVRLAEALGLGVVAEGVETAEQLRALQALGCDLVQGYLFAYPEPPEIAGPLLDERTSVVIN
jgi:diguanylate cyclase (GGDEF)-like protein/PAS domain S-box-containing protein